MTVQSPPLQRPESRRDNWFLRHRLKLRHLNVLLAVEVNRNIGRAALALHTSQPAVSKALQEIERAAGAELFERRPGGTVPTPAGETLLRYAREIFGAIERAGVDLESMSSTQSGSLAIGCNFSSGGDAVPRALAMVKRAEPTVAVRLQEGSLEMLLPQLRTRKLDLLVARWPRGRQISDLEETASFEQPMCVVCAMNHPLARARSLAWKKLEPWPWILPPEGSAARDDLEELFRSTRIRARRAGIECASIFAITVLLRELQALAVCPQEIARHLREEKLLAILPLSMPPVFGANSVITLRAQEHTPAMKTFVQCLREVTSGK
jgi:DNA-binding transcriptional LysR family regulator